MGILEDVPIKVGDFYVPIDLVVLDMVENSRTKIILGRSFLATVGCKIDIKKGKPTFDVGEHHVEFGLFKDFKSSSNFASYGCEVLDSNKLVSMLNMTLNDPSSFDCTLFEGSGFDGLTVDSLPPNIVENEPYIVNEGYLNNLCRFVTLMMSMTAMDGIGCDVDVVFEGGPSDGAHPRIVVFMDLSLWKYYMLKKDLNPESLRWFLLLQQFNFEVHEKG